MRYNKGPRQTRTVKRKTVREGAGNGNTSFGRQKRSNYTLWTPAQHGYPVITDSFLCHRGKPIHFR